MKKSLFFILISVILGCLTACDDKNSSGPGPGPGPTSTLVDLGLPSGTLWKSTNEVNADHTSKLFTYGEAVENFKGKLPSDEQFQELLDKCTITLKDGKCVFTGPNNKSITFTLDGYTDPDKSEIEHKGSDGWYWTSVTNFDVFGEREGYENDAVFFALYIEGGKNGADIDYTIDKYTRISVRLVDETRRNLPEEGGEGVKTVSEIMNIYKKLALAPGDVSAGTYTVRGYVTKWNSGYPDYQNADFWIDDSATGSTSLLKCFRLVGLNDSDKRTLNVGDYIEAQNCYLMNYNGTAELKDGHFTVIRSSSPTSGLGSQVSDFVGTWSCSQYNNNISKFETVSVEIYTWTMSGTGEEWIAVRGLGNGYAYQEALGEHDSYNKVLRLYSSYFFDSDERTYWDTTYLDIFYPVCVVYSGSGWDGYVVGDGGNYGKGEAWLSFNSAGKLVMGGSNNADQYGRYANGYAFATYVNDNHTGWRYTYSDVTMTKISSSVSAPARQMRKSEWHAPMALPKRTTARPAARK